MTYEQLVMKWLDEHGSITPNDAIYGFGCTRLSAYIKILRNKGFPISTEIEHGINRFGKPTHWARYRLED